MVVVVRSVDGMGFGGGGGGGGGRGRGGLGRHLPLVIT